MNNLNEMFGKIDKIDKIRKTKIQNTVVDKMNNLNENFGKIMFGNVVIYYLGKYNDINNHYRENNQKFHNVVSFRKNSKAHG